MHDCASILDTIAKETSNFHNFSYGPSLHLHLFIFAYAYVHVPVRGSALHLIKSASIVSPISSSAVMSLLQLARGSLLIQYDIACLFCSISSGKLRLISSCLDWGMHSLLTSDTLPHHLSTFTTALHTVEGVRIHPEMQSLPLLLLYNHHYYS